MTGAAGNATRRRLRSTAASLIVGVIVTVSVAWGLTWIAPMPAATLSVESAASENLEWTITVWKGIGSTLVHSAPQAGLNWSPTQVTGPPDAGGPGDSIRAWASLTADGQREWLKLDFGAPVLPVAIEVHENDRPGAIDRVSVSTGSDGDDLVVWEGRDPTPAGASMGVSRIPIEVDFPVRFVRLSLDSVAVPGWNEIDAVALVGTDGTRHWAVDATASSTYATVAFPQPVPMAAPEAILPRWSDVEMSVDGPARGGAEVVQEAWGLPFRALRCRFEPPSAASRPWRLRGGIPLPRRRVVNAQGNLTLPRALPVHPIWIGLILDVVIVAVAIRLVMLALAPPVRFVRRAVRVSGGRCPSCGHDLRYDLAQGCSECGWLR